MLDLVETIFAWLVCVLAVAACVGGLVLVLVAEWFALLRMLRRHSTLGPTTWTDQHATGPLAPVTRGNGRTARGA